MARAQPSWRTASTRSGQRTGIDPLRPRWTSRRSDEIVEATRARRGPPAGSVQNQTIQIEISAGCPATIAQRGRALRAVRGAVLAGPDRSRRARGSRARCGSRAPGHRPASSLSIGACPRGRPSRADQSRARRPDRDRVRRTRQRSPARGGRNGPRGRAHDLSSLPTWSMIHLAHLEGAGTRFRPAPSGGPHSISRGNGRSDSDLAHAYAETEIADDLLATLDATGDKPGRRRSRCPLGAQRYAESLAAPARPGRVAGLVFIDAVGPPRPPRPPGRVTLVR